MLHTEPASYEKLQVPTSFRSRLIRSRINSERYLLGESIAPDSTLALFHGLDKGDPLEVLRSIIELKMLFPSGPIDPVDSVLPLSGIQIAVARRWCMEQQVTQLDGPISIDTFIRDRAAVPEFTSNPFIARFLRDRRLSRHLKAYDLNELDGYTALRILGSWFNIDQNEFRSVSGCGKDLCLQLSVPLAEVKNFQPRPMSDVCIIGPVSIEALDAVYLGPSLTASAGEVRKMLDDAGLRSVDLNLRA